MIWLESLGKYFLFLRQVIRRPQRISVFWRLFMRELWDLGVNSVGIVIFISLFMGAVTALQMAQNFQTSVIPIPDVYVGFATKAVLILEFSPTIVSLILAGKVGSYIASSIGTMRVTEQVDALEVMGINAPSYLVQPKIAAFVLFNPVLNMISIMVGLFGGYLIGELTNMWSAIDYIDGIRFPYRTSNFVYSFTKSAVFAFVIATLPSFAGYYVKGGSLEVGRSSTNAVVWTSVLIIILNLILTQMFLG